MLIFSDIKSYPDEESSTSKIQFQDKTKAIKIALLPLTMAGEKYYQNYMQFKKSLACAGSPDTFNIYALGRLSEKMFVSAVGYIGAVLKFVSTIDRSFIDDNNANKKLQAIISDAVELPSELLTLWEKTAVLLGECPQRITYTSTLQSNDDIKAYQKVTASSIGFNESLRLGREKIGLLLSNVNELESGVGCRLRHK